MTRKLKNPPKVGRETLIDLYVTQRLSPATLARRYEVHERTVRLWMEYHGIAREGSGHLRKGKSATWNVGLVRSAETKQRISDAKKASARPPPNKDKGRVRFNCEICGAEVFDKPYRRKRTCSKQCGYALSSVNRGESHWNFKGVGAVFRQKKRIWAEFKEWRVSVLAIGNYTCLKCKQPGGKLTVHHVKNYAQHPELALDKDNGVVFCWPCHKDFHKAYGFRNNNKEQVLDYVKM